MHANRACECFFFCLFIFRSFVNDLRHYWGITTRFQQNKYLFRACVRKSVILREKKTTVSNSTICLHGRKTKNPSQNSNNRSMPFVPLPLTLREKKKIHWRIALKLMMCILNRATNAWLMALLTAWMSTAKKKMKERERRREKKNLVEKVFQVFFLLFCSTGSLVWAARKSRPSN